MEPWGLSQMLRDPQNKMTKQPTYEGHLLRSRSKIDDVHTNILNLKNMVGRSID